METRSDHRTTTAKQDEDGGEEKKREGGFGDGEETGGFADPGEIGFDEDAASGVAEAPAGAFGEGIDTIPADATVGEGGGVWAVVTAKFP